MPSGGGAPEARSYPPGYGEGRNPEASLVWFVGDKEGLHAPKEWRPFEVETKGPVDVWSVPDLFPGEGRIEAEEGRVTSQDQWKRELT